MTNLYYKLAPNVWVLQSEQPYNKGDVVRIANKYGKENEHIVHNLFAHKGIFYYYSITRADGLNAQVKAENRAKSLIAASQKAMEKSNAAYDAAHEGREFLSLGEPIKVGHHSEGKHRALIARDEARMRKSVNLEIASQEYADRAKYWESQANIINLSMPESLDFYQRRLEEAKEYQDFLKSNPNKRVHSHELSYATKLVKDLTTKAELARRLWSDQ